MHPTPLFRRFLFTGMTVVLHGNEFLFAERKSFMPSLGNAFITPHMDETPAAPSPDEDLIARVAQGEALALAELYDRYSRPLFGLALQVLHDPREAEDVLQEAFVQVWKTSHRYEAKKGRLFGWLVTLTRNLAIDHLRKRQRQAKLTEAYSAEPFAWSSVLDQPVRQIEGQERASQVRQALQTLPVEQRQAIELAFFGAFSQSEIAEKLSEPLGTVKARIRRGLLKLRAELGDSL